MTDQTRRQQLVELLLMGEWSFEELRQELAMPVRLLEEELTHVGKSARHLPGGPRRLEVTPARCRACDYAFEQRKGGRLTTPSRCPRCRAERIEPARLTLR